jgi:hypothetical protein
VLTWLGAQTCGATTVGVAQFPLRRWFYDLAAPSTRSYMQRWGLSAPMDYTHRDFVPLAALGLDRHHTPIELAVTPAGEVFRDQLLYQLAQLRQTVGLDKNCPVLGLNIGWGNSSSSGLTCWCCAARPSSARSTRISCSAMRSALAMRGT